MSEAGSPLIPVESVDSEVDKMDCACVCVHVCEEHKKEGGGREREGERERGTMSCQVMGFNGILISLASKK